MQTKEYTVIDKSAWPRGPWDNEPDKRQWQDEATGLPCMVRRVPNKGFLCGYVGVHEGHPLFEQGWDSPAEGLRAHGGLNYFSFCNDNGGEELGICHVVEPGENDRVWWLGFDCAHGLDFAPGERHFYESLGCTIPRRSELDGRDAKNEAGHLRQSYCDFDYVVEQCRDLAQQLAAMIPAA